jgi:nucleotide-binding universal stress UspA family protein
MKPLERILFPVDLTENSEKLAPYVVTMARKLEAEVHVLFVVRIFRYFTKIYVAPPSIEAFERELKEGATRKMGEFIETHFRELPQVHSAVIFGDPADAIVQFIQDQDIRMVIMGTHGRKGLDRVLFGSVAEWVIKTAGVPVLVINPYTTGS